MKFQVILLLCAILISLSNAQFDGSFWWKNKDVVNSASNSRSLKDQTAKIRTLPPRYRHEEEESPTTKRTIFTDESEEDKANYKYDDEPDCVCVPKYLCNENNILNTDGTGIIDERSFNLCGKDNVCCKLPRATSSTTGTPIPQRVSTTTPKSYFNFNINNITNLFGTILRPVHPQSPTVIHQSTPYKCISKKGGKLQERILVTLTTDDEEEENSELTGSTAFLEYPWMIELLIKNHQKKLFEYKCGGVLISPTTAITANHCLKSKIPSNFIVRAGEWDRASTLEYTPHQDRVVTQIISHPLYYAGGLFNDIAILKFEALKSEVNVQPLCLPDEDLDDINSGKYCTVTGWGSANATQSHKTTDVLRFVKVPIVDRDQCEKSFQRTKLGSRFKLHESFLCAGGEKGLDTCTNDGGSPLVCSNGGSYYLHGLVSWGLGCGESGIPGVYTNINNLLKWIKSNI